MINTENIYLFGIIMIPGVSQGAPLSFKIILLGDSGIK